MVSQIFAGNRADANPGEVQDFDAFEGVATLGEGRALCCAVRPQLGVHLLSRAHQYAGRDRPPPAVFGSF